MRRIPEEILKNRAYTNLALSFNEQEPGNTRDGLFGGQILPDSVTILENGDARLCIYAPDAKEVTAGLMEREQFALTRREGGIWEGILPFPGYGVITIDWHIDGNRVLNPHAPVYYSYNRPVNYVDIPDPQMDYVLIQDVPHGSVAFEYFRSEVTGNFERCMVYTPPGYETGEHTYPVLYLQHGGGENEVCWTFNGKVNFIMDNLLAKGKATPCIIVMCNGSLRLADEDCFTYSGFLKMLRLDCIPFIERKYRVKSGKWNRAMAGLSMGSAQTLELGFTYPELFGYLGVFSGALKMDPRGAGGDIFEDVPDKEKRGDTADYLKILKNPDKVKQEYRLFFRSRGRDDVFLPQFEQDDIVLKECRLSPEEWKGHILRIYDGRHCWNVWRQSIYDFLQMIFLAEGDAGNE